MYFLNYIYFLIITLYGLKFLFQKQGIVTHPLNKKQKLLFTGPELFWTLTFSTGLLALSAPAGLDLMALRLMVLEVFCIIGLFVVKNRPVWAVPIIFYLLYILWLCIGLSYTPSLPYGIRVILKYIYPLVIMLVSSAIVRNWEVAVKASLGARIVAIISICVFFIPYIGHIFPGVFWYGTAAAINYISMCILSLALYFYNGKHKKDLILTFIFIIPCVLWVFRTSIVGSVLAIVVFVIFRYKIKSIPIIFVILILSVCSVFFIPSIRDKTFYNKKTTISNFQKKDISKEDIDTNGRFAVWEWSMEHFYKGKELTGCGTGNLQEVFYSLKHPFGTIKIVHNDYVQMLCDNGIIGVLLFVLSFFSFIVHCFIVYNNKKHSVAIRTFAITAGSSMAGVLLTMYTDNVINYSMATISYPCGFYGMMLGLLISEKNKKKYAV